MHLFPVRIININPQDSLANFTDKIKDKLGIDKEFAYKAKKGNARLKYDDVHRKVEEVIFGDSNPYEIEVEDAAIEVTVRSYEDNHAPISLTFTSKDVRLSIVKEKIEQLGNSPYSKFKAIMTLEDDEFIPNQITEDDMVNELSEYLVYQDQKHILYLVVDTAK
mmetsp:Transcript_6881/g.6175  ORF Transcript_6881/g.6175 Transcript_6881/m.6175 type:complete len:164 (+) Transcript_6881:77-568(+)|eukprot:CAMPEP_0114596348 /NCGR_PEP_ID=MMETSP0125-20121206/18335_1 /TAXON_ID=485358 ORGANISM="Aristerostoma sp., Strain ATCC 50986" /NCGR_SAMPLE_ID=MMETSP0125 /ASSEMBLY_ACC=CAM_ASM_000245 /LENGTH=163 /DNA_ID=CAMNT_0001799223 /DNA_START=1640 /DNA_END=2131 /DNA_ORIENTATION=+